MQREYGRLDGRHNHRLPYIHRWLLLVAAVPLGAAAGLGRAAPSAAELATACRETAQHVAGELGPQGHVIVRSPWVLGGELSEAQLQQRWRTTIEPAARAMSAAYFTTPPSEPITVLLFADEDRYRRYAQTVFGDEHLPRGGYYRPHLRTVLVNTAAGSGALLHELTHALMAFDFPDAPAWLSEGLASLHEQAVVSEDGRRLIGQSGPRRATLQTALRAGRLPSLRTLLATEDFHGPDEKLNYAQARYFCLYLQQQGALSDCYRRLRAGRGNDRRGEKTILDLLPGRTWDQLDAEFQRFVAAQ